MSYLPVLVYWSCVIAGRSIGGGDWCPAWLGILLFVAMFPVHWVPFNRLVDRLLGATNAQ